MPNIDVTVEIFRGSITSIDVKTQTPPESYRYIQQKDGSYTRTHTEAGKTSEPSGRYTLDDIDRNLRMYDETKGDAMMLLRLFGDSHPLNSLNERPQDALKTVLLNTAQSYPTISAGMDALTPHFNMSKATLRVGNEADVQKWKKQYDADKDIKARLNDAIYMYQAATSHDAQQMALVLITQELTPLKEKGALPDMLRDKGVAQRLWDVFESETKTNPLQKEAAMAQVWLDDCREAQHTIDKQDKDAPKKKSARR